MNSQANTPIFPPCHAIPPSCQRDDELSEESLTICTYNHQFKNRYDSDFNSYLEVNGNCSGECQQALNNAQIVARFVQINLPSERLNYTSRININRDFFKQPVSAVWSGADECAFFGRTGGKNSGSYASSLTVVAHEFGHMLNEKKINLKYEYESGALDESYADIFAILVSNRDQPDDCIREDFWNWNIGGESGTNITIVRNLQNPSLYDQPEHYDHWVNTRSDHGGVHRNSGIHNKAVYELLISRDYNNHYLLDISLAAELFYGALLILLKFKSSDGFYEPTFLDSRNAIYTFATTQFESELDPTKMEQIRSAITSAFDSVGVFQQSLSDSEITL
jgi:Zn-dependent metalloprotease